MVIRKKILLDFSDLNMVHVECATCKVQMRFDVSKPDFTIPEVCPSCNVAFESTKHQLDAYRRAYGSLSQSKNKVTVEVEDLSS